MIKFVYITCIMADTGCVSRFFPSLIFALLLTYAYAVSQQQSDADLNDGYGVTQDYGNTYGLSQDLYNPDHYNNYPKLPNGDPAPTYASNHDPYGELQGTKETETGDQEPWDGYAGDQEATTPATQETAGYDPYSARGGAGGYDPYAGRRGTESETEGQSGNEDRTGHEEATTQSPYGARDPYTQDRQQNLGYPDIYTTVGGSDGSQDGYETNTVSSANRDNYETVDPYAYATTAAVPWAGNYGDRHTQGQEQSVSSSSGYNPYAGGQAVSGSSHSGSDPYSRGQESPTSEPDYYPPLPATAAPYDPYGAVETTTYDPYAGYRYQTSRPDTVGTSYTGGQDYQQESSTQGPSGNSRGSHSSGYDPYRGYETTTVNYWNTPNYDSRGNDPYGNSYYQTTTQNYWNNRNYETSTPSPYYGGYDRQTTPNYWSNRNYETSTQSPYYGGYDRQTTQPYYGGYNYGNQNTYNHPTTPSLYSSYGSQYHTTPQYNNHGYGNGYNNYGSNYNQGGYSSSNSHPSYGNGNNGATTPAPTCIQYNPVSNGNGGSGGYNPPPNNSGENCCTFYRNGMTCRECTSIQGGHFARRTTCSGSWASSASASSSWAFKK